MTDDVSKVSSEQQQQQQQKQQPPPPPRPKVKSYLHKFYDCSVGGVGGDVSAPPMAGQAEADDELRRLLAAGGGCGVGSFGKQRRSCYLRPIVWKAMLWIGVNCLIFGALGLAIAFFLPHEPDLVEVPGVQGFVRSRSNAEWNRSAAVLKYVALGVFGLGAAVTAAGLILPSLVWRLFDEEDGSSTTGSIGSAGRRQHQQQQQRGPLAPRTTTTMIGPPAPLDEKPVQPARSPEEGHVTGGQVKVK